MDSRNESPWLVILMLGMFIMVLAFALRQTNQRLDARIDAVEKKCAAAGVR